MDERLMFERFHEALGVDARPGGYERMRNALIEKTTKPRRRAAFLNTRFNKMGFRLIAAIALVAVAVTAGAVFFAAHRVANNNIPAASDSNTLAYQRLIAADDAKMAAAASNHCATIDDTGCAAAVARVNAVLQQWLGDLSGFSTPQAYRVADLQLRVHINAAISELNLAVLEVNTLHRPDVFAAAVAAAGNERGWIDAMVGSINTRHAVSTSIYVDFVRSEKSAVDACPECNQLRSATPTSCTLNPLSDCQNLTALFENVVQSFQVGLVLYPAPPAMAGRDQKLQSDLASASAATITMMQAALNGDKTSWDSARLTFVRALDAVDTDASAILGA